MGGARRFALAALAATAVAAWPTEPAEAGSSDVAAAQVAMSALGLYPHPVDGISGPWTVGAVESFQRSHGLTADGIAGPKTRRALGWRGRPDLGDRPMRRGHRGWDVAALQFLLSGRGFGPGGFDGGFGPNTSSAVRRFQAAAGLEVDGVAGSATIAALSQEVVAEPPGDPVRFLRPLPGPIGDGFGFVAGRRHTGIDFPAAAGATVGAAGRGTVAFAGWNSGGYGNLVVIRHRLGFESWYAHLSSISVGPGQAVVGGTPIGAVGSTGRSTGPHLHFEVRLFGTPIDPMPRLLSGTAARASGSGVARSSAARPAAPRPAGRRLRCRPNGDARGRRADPLTARIGRCP
jgi:peptidoglycan hydrolase-like protein with peptidoglycan-binding domain